ncbi:hypothetical protein ACO0K9_26765 [Undibacterium sp. Ji50W]|uniref:hypothetical protein n=1 Tax=Undibacterium sp. Ji50W TaxID=3413041 RepID=UPI003BF02F0C
MLRVITAGALALMLTACGSMPTRIALEPATKQNLVEVKVLSVLPQDEVIVRAETFGASAALGGGLIGAMIDSKVAEGRQNTMQDVLAPFYQSVDDYDFRTGFERNLGAALANGATLKFAPLERTAMPMLPKDLVARVAAVKVGNGHLTIVTKYAFTSDFSRLNVTAYAEMKMPGLEKPIYLNTFVYQSKATGTGGADSIKSWSDNKGTTYRATMDEASRELIAMLQIDLAANATDPLDAAKATLEKVDGTIKLPVSGVVLATNGERKILRNTAGNIYSLVK